MSPFSNRQQIFLQLQLRQVVIQMAGRSLLTSHKDISSNLFRVVREYNLPDSFSAVLQRLDKMMKCKKDHNETQKSQGNGRILAWDAWSWTSGCWVAWPKVPRYWLIHIPKMRHQVNSVIFWNILQQISRQQYWECAAAAPPQPVPDQVTNKSKKLNYLRFWSNISLHLLVK